MASDDTKGDADFHEMKSVLPSHMAGGPMGFGDPNDRTLRKVETDVLIPKRMKEKAHILCAKEVAEFMKCGKEQGLLLPFKCRKQNNEMSKCLKAWYENEEFRQEVTEAYLAERAQYRQTGQPLKYRGRIH